MLHLATLILSLIGATGGLALPHLGWTSKLDWKLLELPDRHPPIRVQFSLKRNQTRLSLFLDERLSEQSEAFRIWASDDDVRSLIDVVDPAPLTDLLSAHGIQFERVFHDIVAHVPPPVAHAVLGSPLVRIAHTAGQRGFATRGVVALPPAAGDVVAAITGINEMPMDPAALHSGARAVRTIKRPRAAGAAVGADVEEVSPLSIADLRALYRVPVNPTAPRGRVVVFAWADRWFNQSDLDDFYEVMDVTTDIPSTARAAVREDEDEADRDHDHEDGGRRPTITTHPDATPATPIVALEATADVAYVSGMAPRLQTEFWSVPGDALCGALKALTAALLVGRSRAPPPTVVAITYAYGGDLDAVGCSSEARAAVERDFEVLAAYGTTVVAAAGDNGGDLGLTAGRLRLRAAWPARASNVVAVGATSQRDPRVASRVAGGVTEVAPTNFGGGGGFADGVDIPPWQQAHVRGYASQLYRACPASADYIYPEMSTAPCNATTPHPLGLMPPLTLWSQWARGVPDMAALGQEMFSFWNGRMILLSGTSVSTAIVAAAAGVTNEYAVAAGRPVLGFMSQWMYSATPPVPINGALDAAGDDARLFTDVIAGHSRRATDGQRVASGWVCTQGWDAVTGLGTPRVDRWIEALMTK